MIRIDLIRTDGGTQARAGIDEGTVAEYAEQMRDETTVFPPVIVYHDGKDYWLADGFHRVAAWRRIGRAEIPAEIRQGTRRDAILHACQANATHGLRRTAADKRRAVETLLRDPEWSQWSDREIARRCAVSHPFVRKIRAEIAAASRGNAAVRHTGNVSSEGPKSLENNDPKTGVAANSSAHGEEAHAGNTEDAAPQRGDEADRRKYVDRHGNETVMRVRRQADAAPRHTGNVASEDLDQPCGDDTDDVDPLAPFRKGLSALTRAGLEDEVAGLRAENADLRRAVKRLEDENATLKERVKWLEAEDDMGRKLGMALRQRDEARGRAKEYQAQLAREKRIALTLQKRVKELEAAVEDLRQNQVIELT